MALKSTVFKASLQVSDLDRHHYADYPLTLARHPSETDERMMVRLLAFALYASEQLRFGKGLSTDEDPALAEEDLTGTLLRWIDVGLPDETRLRKACTRAEQVVIVAYGQKAPIWWQQIRESAQRFTNLTVWQLSTEDSQHLARLAARSMQLAWTIQEGTVYVDGQQIQPQQLYPAL